MPENQDEQFVQSRLLTASLLSAIAVMAYFYFIAPSPPAEPEQGQAVEQASVEQPASPPDETSEAPPAEPAASISEEPAAASDEESAPAEYVAAEAEREIIVETSAYRVAFTNRGAAVKRWKLHHYEDAEGGELDLVHAEGAERLGRPFSLVRPGGGEIPGLAEALFAVNDGPDLREAPTTVEFTLVQGGRRVRKSFRFEHSGYVAAVETELEENGLPQPHQIAWPGGFGDFSQPSPEANSNIYYHPPEVGIERIHAGDAAEELPRTGPYEFAGIEDLFFTAAFLPEAGGPSVTVEGRAVELRPDQESDDVEEFAAFSVGSASGNRFNVYVGPKDVDELQAVHPGLREVVDFGTYLGVIAQPLFLMLRWVYANIVSNWGWAIVVLTIFINTALFPLKWKSSKSMKRMQKIQPLVKQINDKYKGVGMTDPKKQKQNEELMELYKKYDVNPAGGCLPMLLQMPFFIAFYSVLTVAIEMRGADWLWVTDLSRPETLPIRILPVTMIASQFLMQSLTPTPSVDPAQARMMKLMPLMMGFIFYQFSAGLVLYWLTSNVVGIGQQLLLNKMPGEEIEIERPKGRPGKKAKKK